ncbi:MAG TPA: anthranilate phosphoribosyltransferase, partial [Phycisphaerales bacterium]|nr:anthranilate phosphoribosyltransferase [Phycisphaerales bacterium]
MVSIVEYLEPLLGGRDLSMEQAGGLLDAVFAGEVPEAQVAAFLTAMRVKGATAAELAGLAGSLRRHAVRVEPGVGPLVDTCGTGGGTIK